MASVAAFGDLVEDRLDRRVGFDHCTAHRANKILASLSHFLVSGLHARILHCLLPRGFQFFALLGRQISQSLLPAAAAAASFGSSLTLGEDEWGEL